MIDPSVFDFVLTKLKIRIGILILMISFPGIMSAQTVSVDEQIIYDFHRRNQILGIEDSNYSFTIKPIQFVSLNNFNAFFEPKKKYPKPILNPFFFNRKNGVLILMPLYLATKFNSHHPVGYNDGAMIPARGFQTMLRIGFYAKYGPISLQIQPEFVYAVNKDYEGYSSQYRHDTDLPIRFSPGNKFKESYWGQSSLRFNYRNYSFGISTENLWWGPGIHNSLLMSNSAPGFPHLTFNSQKPFQTKYGFFEFQLISGRLSNSQNRGTEVKELYWRYINALIVSFQPKWVEGLYLGAIRSYTKFGKDLDGLTDYLPSLLSFGTNYSLSNPLNNTNREHLESYFIRWIWDKSNAEIYLEYGRKENVVNVQEEPYGPIYNNAYILGFRKLITFNKSEGSYIDLTIELTQLELNQAILNNTYSWYEHPIVFLGYTHLGQTIGAGIGPGSNLQTLDISWVRDLKKIGFRFERLLHNHDFFFSDIKDYRSEWVDLSATAYVHWDYKRFLFNFQMKFVKSLNYNWVYTPSDISFWDGEGWDVFNVHGILNLSYRF